MGQSLRWALKFLSWSPIKKHQIRKWWRKIMWAWLNQNKRSQKKSNQRKATQAIIKLIKIFWNAFYRKGLFNGGLWGLWKTFVSSTVIKILSQISFLFTTLKFFELFFNLLEILFFILLHQFSFSYFAEFLRLQSIFLCKMTMAVIKSFPL